MAFPTVAGQNSGTNGNGTSHPFTYDTSPSAGDLLILEISFDDLLDGTASISGWITMVDVIGNSAATAQRSYVFGRYADGTEGTGGTVTFTQSEGSAWVVRRITGHNVTSNSDITNRLGIDYAQFQPSSSSTTYDPPNLAPANFGAGDNLAGGGGGWDGASNAHVSYPSDLTDNRASQVEATTGIASGTVNTTAASYNPGTGSITNSEQWSSWTWMVQPTAGGGTPSGPAYLQQDGTSYFLLQDGTSFLLREEGGGATPQALPATSTFTPALTRVALYQRTLAPASTFTADLTRLAAYYRTLAVTPGFDPVMTRVMFVLLAVAATFAATLDRGVLYLRTLSPSVTFAPSLSRFVAYFRDLAATSTFTPSLTRFALYLRLLPTSSTFAIDIQRRISLALAVASTFTPVLIFGRLFSRALAATSTFAASLSLVLNVTLAATSTFAVSVTRLVLYQVPLAVASTFGVTMLRAFAVVLAVPATFAVTMTKLIPKALAVGSTFGVLLERVLNVTLAVASTFTPTLVRTAVYNVTLAVNATFGATFVKLVLIDLAVSAGLAVALGRDFTVTLAVASTFGAVLVESYRTARSLPAVSTFVSGLATLLIPGGGPGPAISSFLARFLHIRK